MGAFKMIQNGKSRIYEIELIVEEAQSLALRVKHFTGEFVAWEEKDKFVDFPLVKLTDDAAYFSGLTFRRDGPDRIEMYLSMSHDGQQTEEHWVYARTPAGSKAKTAEP